MTIGGGFRGGLYLHTASNMDGRLVQPVEGYFGSFLPMIREFVLTAQGQKKADIDPVYTLGEPLIMWAIYRSMKNKAWTKVTI